MVPDLMPLIEMLVVFSPPALLISGIFALFAATLQLISVLFGANCMPASGPCL